MGRALVALVGDADLGEDPPAIRSAAAIERAELLARIALSTPVQRPRHGPAHDLAVDEFVVLVRTLQQIVDGRELDGLHGVSVGGLHSAWLAAGCSATAVGAQRCRVRSLAGLDHPPVPSRQADPRGLGRWSTDAPRASRAAVRRLAHSAGFRQRVAFARPERDHQCRGAPGDGGALDAGCPGVYRPEPLPERERIGRRPESDSAGAGQIAKGGVGRMGSQVPTGTSAQGPRPGLSGRTVGWQDLVGVRRVVGRDRMSDTTEPGVGLRRTAFVASKRDAGCRCTSHPCGRPRDIGRRRGPGRRVFTIHRLRLDSGPGAAAQKLLLCRTISFDVPRPLAAEPAVDHRVVSVDVCEMTRRNRRGPVVWCLGLA